MDNLLFSLQNEKVSEMNEDRKIAPPHVPTRIAVYDNLLSAPRIVDIPPSDIVTYLGQIAAKTYELAQAQGSEIPYTVIKEVCENFIHAQFQEPCVSILDGGNTIKFTDQGPGIQDKERAQLPGFTSATTEMREYINGVGSGLPTVKDYLRFSNGRLIIEDNLQAGTVVTITIDRAAPEPVPVVYREPARPKEISEPPKLKDREYDILVLAQEMGTIGPTEVNQNLGIPNATAYRDLCDLESKGLLALTESRKRMITDQGLMVLNGQR